MASLSAVVPTILVGGKYSSSSKIWRKSSIPTDALGVSPSRFGSTRSSRSRSIVPACSRRAHLVSYPFFAKMSSSPEISKVERASERSCAL
ncbi:hypothetical protein D3C76_1142350 [compost metagenome]